MRKINTDIPEYIFYSTINELISKIDEVNEDAEISWNSKGGSVWAGFQFIDFLNTNENKLTANVTGIAASMGAVLLPFFSYVKGANEADIMLHASSGGVRSTVKNTNKTLYEALAKKIDEVKFKEITGHELKAVMMAEGENIIDVWFTGKQAKQFGLFDESYPLLEKAATLNSMDFKELGYELPDNIKEKYGFKKVNKLNKNEMELKDVTASMLLTGNKEAYNSIFDEGKKAEQTAESERIAEIKKYAKYDVDYAFNLIEKGAKLSNADVEHFMEKKFDNAKLNELKEGSEAEIKPAKPIVKDAKTEEQEEIEKEKSAILESNDLNDK